MLTLTDSALGSLDLRAIASVRSLQIGSPTAREVMRPRALADGMIDDTNFRGQRAITLTLTLKDRPCGAEPTTIQGLLDLLLPYVSPRRRPLLTWALPGTESEHRAAVVRGVSAPVVIERSKHPTVVVAFVVASGEVFSPTAETLIIDPTTDVESGRSYNLAFNRVYPASTGIGNRLVINRGNAPAHWKVTLFGVCTNPTFAVNGSTVAFTANGGLALPAGGTVMIDTRERTIRYADDPAQSKYEKVNFTAWTWDALLLQPGENTVRFNAGSLGTGARAELTWHPTWE